MSDYKGQPLNEAHPQVDWSNVKTILNEILASLRMVDNMLPNGTFKNVLSTIIGLVSMILNWI